MSRRIVGVKFYKESRNKSMDNIKKAIEKLEKHYEQY